VASDELGRWCSKVNLSEMLNVAKRTGVQYRANACMYTASEKSYSTRFRVMTEPKIILSSVACISPHSGPAS